MIKEPYDYDYDMSYSGYVVRGPGTYIYVGTTAGKAKAYAVALNNAYLLGRLQYLESQFPDVEIPVNTAGPEVGSN